MNVLELDLESPKWWSALEEDSFISMKIGIASIPLPGNRLSSLLLPFPSSFPAKTQAQNPSGNFAASVLGRSDAGSTLQARSTPAVHSGLNTCCFWWSQQDWGAHGEHSYHADLCQRQSLGNSQSVHTAVPANSRVTTSSSPEELSRWFISIHLFEL